MTDQLYLSIWLERDSRTRRLKYFEQMLRLFPFSQRAQGQTTVSVQAVDSTEPPLLERPLNGPVEVEEVLAILHDYTGEDVAQRVESFWDLWQFNDNEWALTPARVALICQGPEFDNNTDQAMQDQEQIRIEFGVDINYLPQPEIAGSGRMTESNLRSLLRLVHELDSTLPVRKRRLETESGENFAERLQQFASASAGGEGAAR
jgi:hypothetical protein